MTQGMQKRAGAFRFLLIAAVFAAALQSLVPAGYMPSFAGGRIALVECHGFVEVRQDANAHAHHHGVERAPAHEDGGKPGHDDEHRSQPCAFAIAGHFVLDAPAPAIASQAIWIATIFVAPIFRLEAIEVRAQRARGPPLFF